MFEALADGIALRLGKAISERGKGSLVVPGGTTPGALFDVLCRHKAPWAQVTVTLSDERWVEPDSKHSNEHLVRHRLLREEAAAAHFVPWKIPNMGVREAEAPVNLRLEGMPRPFDFVVLGMGDDGHTASLIPQSEGLAAALDMMSPKLARTIRAPTLGERMTLTLRAILMSRSIAILIRGAEKRATFEAAQAGTEVAAMPVRGVLYQAQVPVEVWWSP